MRAEHPVPPIVADTGRDLSRLIDAFNAAEDAAKRGKITTVRASLRTCFDLARKIARRRKSTRARRLFRKAGK